MAGDDAWKWTRRILGVVGFAYLLYIEATTDVELPLALYTLIAGLLGLDYLLDFKRRMDDE